MKCGATWLAPQVELPLRTASNVLPEISTESQLMCGTFYRSFRLICSFFSGLAEVDLEDLF